MFDTNIHLLQFQIQSHFQKRGIWNAGTPELTPKTKQNKTKQNKTKQKQKQNKKQNKTKQKQNKQTNKQTKKCLKILTLHLPFCRFLIKNRIEKISKLPS